MTKYTDSKVHKVEANQATAPFATPESSTSISDSANVGAEGQLSWARYGKDNVRVLKVSRDPTDRETQHVTEYVVCCLLEGNVDRSYTHADNSPIVATDTIKNTVFIKAKENAIEPAELFGAELGSHFVNTYKHIHSAHVDISLVTWTRMSVAGKPHKHSFVANKNERNFVHVDVFEGANGRAGPVSITSQLKDLTVLKSTGSMFYGFHRDEYTTLKDTNDRILSTDIDASWRFGQFENAAAVAAAAKDNVFKNAYEVLRSNTLEIFATQNSPSVQATMYDIARKTIAEVPSIDNITISLPNKHYVELPLDWYKGTQNTGKNAEVYVPTSDPNGLIKCTVSRHARAKL
ncbi:hypothetical protein CANCADRAFT_45103 [Tortispora caseinolytica NRRL Y-17796]|uniref:Uricase n=1 Tax=Tortispora caseinolytica NRRL Y-17796 TaxID=767744 RepID=A0A1E4TA39_9ASCO|nr:hypothetical protein CANCADRAFT_45103 [Tortispora caseinolytica NRRL Y-17796]